jgi:hypothetical protein
MFWTPTSRSNRHCQKTFERLLRAAIIKARRRQGHKLLALREFR